MSDLISCFPLFSISCTVFIDTFFLSNVVADSTCYVSYVSPHVVDRDAIKKKLFKGWDICC